MRGLSSRLAHAPLAIRALDTHINWATLSLSASLLLTAQSFRSCTDLADMPHSAGIQKENDNGQWHSQMV